MSGFAPSIAICIVAYNRVNSLERLLDSLCAANYSCEVPLIISIDKSDTDEVERLADEFVWKFGSKRVVRHKTNLGLRKHILSIGEYVNDYDAVIVLEDDLLVSRCFYTYALEAVQYYKDDDRIAGISLYNFSSNNQTYLPFIPAKNEYDAFLFQNAQSWGQVWMKNQWKSFMAWYMDNSEEFGNAPHLPFTICEWGKNSWLKYHIKYCIEMDKFFVYPYYPLTFCIGAAGMHSSEMNNIPHNFMQLGNMKDYRFPTYDQAVKYDAFFERIGIGHHLGVDDVCFDIHGTKGNREGHRYWLTTRLEPYQVVKSFGLYDIPIEENIVDNNYGEGIFLYDVTQPAKKPTDNTFQLLNYYYKCNGVLRFMKHRGMVKTWLLIQKYTIGKIAKKIWK